MSVMRTRCERWKRLKGKTRPYLNSPMGREEHRHPMPVKIWYRNIVSTKNLWFFLHMSKKSCTSDICLTYGNSPVATFASCGAYANKCIFRKGRCPLSSIPIRSLYASLQARIGTADNRILILFFAEKYIFICVCAIFVVPLQPSLPFWQLAWLWHNSW